MINFVEQISTINTSLIQKNIQVTLNFFDKFNDYNELMPHQELVEYAKKPDVIQASMRHWRATRNSNPKLAADIMEKKFHGFHSTTVDYVLLRVNGVDIAYALAYFDVYDENVQEDLVFRPCPPTRIHDVAFVNGVTAKCNVLYNLQKSIGQAYAIKTYYNFFDVRLRGAIVNTPMAVKLIGTQRSELIDISEAIFKHHAIERDQWRQARGIEKMEKLSEPLINGMHPSMLK